MTENAAPEPSLFQRAALIMDTLAEQPLLPSSASFPQPEFIRARKLEDGSRIPQAIAHRGFKAKDPENTMAAFKGAVEIGAHALETDVHLTKDGVVVLSHDPNLKRCFGKPEKLIDCEWSYIQTLRTVAKPHEPMPRLKELLEYLATPGLEDKWVLLDIKLDNDADDIIRLIASEIASVAPSPSRPWNQRIVLGFWATKFLGVIFKYLPNYPISHIGFSTTYARQFFTVGNVSFNMLQATLVGPIGASFIAEAKKYDRQVFSWTVNEEVRMRWCINKELDGVITDNPEKFLEVCEDYQSLALRKQERTELKRKEAFTVKDYYNTLKIQFFIGIFLVIFRLRFGWGAEKKFVSRKATVPMPVEKK